MMTEIKINKKDDLCLGIKRTYFFRVIGFRNNEQVTMTGVTTYSSFFPNPHIAYDDLHNDIEEQGIVNFNINEFRRVK